MTPSDWVILLILSLLWGGAFMFSGIALRELQPLTIVALRVSIAAVILNLIILFSGRRYNISLKTAGNLLLMGFMNNAIPFSLIVWSQTRITAGQASILNATTPIFTIILAHFLTRDEKITVNRMLGILMGLAGVIVLIGPGVFSNSGSSLLPQLAVLGAGLAYSLSGIFGKRFGEAGMDPIIISGGQLIGSSLILLPLALIVDKPLGQPFPTLQPLLAILGLALFSTALAYILYFRVLKRAGAGNVLLVTMIIPFVAIFLGAAVLGEEIHLRELGALLILVAGLLVIDGRLLRRGK
ncbi:MAG: EamA family transporter [Spirochaetes bacterium]|nr:MAG: EamA family transporter [Spirochaetota bacterium]